MTFFDARADIIYLMLKTCPQCGRNLTQADNYFCHVCGAVTGGGSDVSAKRYYSTSKSSSKKNVSSSFSLWGLLGGVGVFLLLAGSAIVSSYLTNEATDRGGSLITKMFSSNAPVLPQQNNSEMSVVSEGTPRISNVESYLPFQTDLVAVFYSHTDFLDALKFFGVEDTFDVDFLKNSNRPPFVIILNPPTTETGELKTTLLLFPVKEPVKGEYSKYVPEDFSEAILEEAVVLTVDEGIAEEITQVSKGLHKGMGLNSYYVNIRSKIPDNVRSKIFVFSNIGVGYVNQLDTGKMPESLKVLVMNYMKSGSYYGFVEYE